MTVTVIVCLYNDNLSRCTQLALRSLNLRVWATHATARALSDPATAILTVSDLHLAAGTLILSSAALHESFSDCLKYLPSSMRPISISYSAVEVEERTEISGRCASACGGVDGLASALVTFLFPGLHSTHLLTPSFFWIACFITFNPAFWFYCYF